MRLLRLLDLLLAVLGIALLVQGNVVYGLMAVTFALIVVLTAETANHIHD